MLELLPSTFTTKYYKGNKLPHGSISKIMADFNQHFSSVPGYNVDYSTTAKKFQGIWRRFNMRWHASSGRKDFLEASSLNAWKQLSSEEKQKHTLNNCSECPKSMPNLFGSFPLAKKRNTLPSISLSPQDLSNTKRFGKKVLRELNVVTNTRFSQPIEHVLVSTPKLKLEHSKTSAVWQKEIRGIENKVKKDFKKAMVGQDAVLQNRISWRQYKKL